MSAKASFVLFGCLLACWTVSGPDSDNYVEPIAESRVTCTKPGEILADPYNCDIFWVCDDDYIGHYFVCPLPLLFDSVTLTCTDSSTVLCPDAYYPECSADHLYNPEPTNCEGFWFCGFRSSPMYLTCIPGLYYNVDTNTCENAASLPREYGIRPPDLN